MNKTIERSTELVRDSHAMRLETRRVRARSRTLRALLRSEQITSRAIVERARELRAFLLAAKTIARLRAKR